MNRPVMMAAAALAAISVPAAMADSPPPPKQVCLQTNNIQSMSYPDNKTILFRMVGGPVKVWRNDLQRECPGLKFEKGIAWTIWGNEVCSNMQIFYVLNRGTPCALGTFTAQEARGAAAN